MSTMLCTPGTMFGGDLGTAASTGLPGSLAATSSSIGSAANRLVFDCSYSVSLTSSTLASLTVFFLWGTVNCIISPASRDSLSLHYLFQFHWSWRWSCQWPMSFSWNFRVPYVLWISMMWVHWVAAPYAFLDYF